MQTSIKVLNELLSMKETSISLMSNFLNRFSLVEMSKQTEKELEINFKLTQRQANKLVSVFFMNKEIQMAKSKRVDKITSSLSAQEVLAPYYSLSQVEEFYVILLKRNNEIIITERVSTGGINGTVVDPRVIFKLALLHGASSLILSHNHPSGNLNPSEADKAVTRKMVEAGNALEIRVFDHIIIANDGYYSFADEGLI